MLLVELPQSTACSCWIRTGSLPLLAVPRLPPACEVALCHPLAGIDQLHNIDKLLEGHHGSRDSSNRPWPEAVELVSSGHFQSTSTPWASEKAAWGWVSRVSRLRGGGLLSRLQKRWRKSRRGEREQIETNEENLIKGTADEKHSLYIGGQLPWSGLCNFQGGSPCCGSTGTEPSFWSHQPSCGSGWHHPGSGWHTCACNGWPCPSKSNPGKQWPTEAKQSSRKQANKQWCNGLSPYQALHQRW